MLSYERILYQVISIWELVKFLAKAMMCLLCSEWNLRWWNVITIIFQGGALSIDSSLYAVLRKIQGRWRRDQSSHLTNLSYFQCVTGKTIKLNPMKVNISINGLQYHGWISKWVSFNKNTPYLLRNWQTIFRIYLIL